MLLKQLIDEVHRRLHDSFGAVNGKVTEVHPADGQTHEFVKTITDSRLTTEATDADVQEIGTRAAKYAKEVFAGQ